MTRRAGALTILLVAPAALILMLWAAVPAAAQEDDYHLVPVNRQAIEYHTGCYDLVGEGSSWDVHMFCNNQNPTVLIGGDVPSGTVGVVLDASLETTAGSAGINYRFGGSNYLPYFVFVDAPSGSDEARACFFLTNVPGAVEAQFDCEHVTRAATVPDQFRFATGSGSSNMVGELRNISFIVEGPDPNPPTPTPGYEPIGDLDPGDYGGTCVYTSTTGIGTLTSANILPNPSFEIYNYDYFPSGWQKWDPVHTLSSIARSSAAARSGNWGMFYNPGQYGVGQGVKRTFNIDSRTEAIHVGAYVQSPGGGGQADIYIDGVLVDSASDLAEGEWISIGGQVVVEGPKTVEIAVVGSGGAEGGLFFDDFWVYESEEVAEFQVICPAPTQDPIPEPPPLPGSDFGDDVPAPAPTAFGVCYDCIRPLTILEIGGWIKWLLCMIGNLFRCELYLWLLNSINWIRGVWLWLVGLVQWLPEAGQVVLSWVGDALNSALGWFAGIWDRFRMSFVIFLRNLVQAVLDTPFVQDAWVFVTWVQQAFEYVQALLSTFLEMLRSLYMAAVGIAELIQSVVVGVGDAWRAPPDANVFGFLPGAGRPLAPEITEGISGDKIAWLVLVAIASFDAIFGSFGLQYLQYVVFGVVGFGVIAWTLKQFQDIVPI